MLERRTNTGHVADYRPAAHRIEIPPAMLEGAAPPSIFDVLWRRRKVMVVCAAVALVLGWVYFKRIVPVYGSASQIYIQEHAARLIDDRSAGGADASNYLQTQCEIIKSTTVLAAALELPEIKKAHSLQAADAPLALLKYSIAAQVNKQSDLVTVSAESSNPQDAAIIANAVVAAYTNYENNLHRSTASDAVKILQKEKDRQDAEYKATSQAMLEFKRANGMLSLQGDGNNIIMQRLGQLSEALTRAQLDLVDARLSTSSAFLRDRAQAAERRVDEIETAFLAQQKLTLDLNAKAAEYAQLESNLRRTEKLVDVLDSRIKEFNIAADGDSATNVSVLEVAKPSTVPLRPNRTQTLGMALVVGLMCGLGASLMLDRVDVRVRSASEFAALLDLPVLGSIPHITGGKNRSTSGQQMHLDPLSEVAEAYRAVRTGIHFGSSANFRTLLFTSPAQGDGKTTAASNVAIAIAQTGKRVLLIDADCRRPMLHHVYEVNDAVGLTSVLAGRAELQEAICRSTNENLDILPCGPVPPNPAELLNSEAFAETLKELSQQYDRIVIDSPPVGLVSDARILAAACDVTVLVVRAAKTTRRQSEAARNALATVGANLIGLVVNDVPKGSAVDTYYGSRTAPQNGRPIAVSSVKEIKAISAAALSS